MVGTVREKLLAQLRGEGGAASVGEVADEDGEKESDGD